MAVNLGAYWVFGIPLAVWLAFPAGWGVHGLWVGMAVTTTVQASINFLRGLGLHCATFWVPPPSSCIGDMHE